MIKLSSRNSTVTDNSDDTHVGIVVAAGGDILDSVPGCSIKGVKPTITPIPDSIMQQQRKVLAKMKNQAYSGEDKLKRCITCDDLPTMLVTYHLEGASRVERYCDNCLEKQSLKI